MMKSPSFPAIWLAVGAALLLHRSGDLASASSLLPGEGRTLAFERSYTKAHLAKHPKQVVQSMRLRLTLSADGQRVLARLAARKRSEPDAEYSIGGHIQLPADPACLPLVLNPALAGGQVSVELRADGAIRVRVIGHADLRLASGKAPPSLGEGDQTGLWRLTADDEENAVFKLLPVIGGGNESPAPRAIPVGAGAASK